MGRKTLRMQVSTIPDDVAESYLQVLARAADRKDKDVTRGMIGRDAPDFENSQGPINHGLASIL